MITKRDVSLFFCCAALTAQFILCVFFVGAFIGVAVGSFLAGKEYVVGQSVGFAVPLLLEIVVCGGCFLPVWDCCSVPKDAYSLVL